MEVQQAESCDSVVGGYAVDFDSGTSKLKSGGRKKTLDPEGELANQAHPFADVMTGI